jgi:hypothetical protein
MFRPLGPPSVQTNSHPPLSESIARRWSWAFARGKMQLRFKINHYKEKGDSVF